MSCGWLRRCFMRCPSLGRGKARALWDFTRLSKFRANGVRGEESLKRIPMCREDFVDWHVNKCPAYKRSLFEILKFEFEVFFEMLSF